MRDQNPNGLELHWVEVRDEHGTHMEAHWSAAPAATPASTGAHTPHAA